MSWRRVRKQTKGMRRKEEKNYNEKCLSILGRSFFLSTARLLSEWKLKIYLKDSERDAVEWIEIDGK